MNPPPDDNTARRNDTRVEVVSDLNTLAEAAAAYVAETLHDAVEKRGRASLLLSGGSTPLPCYELLAEKYVDSLSWERVHLFWGDERYVPPEDPRSNFGAALATLIHEVPIPGENVHRTPTEPEDSAKAAAEYERTLRAFFSSDDDGRFTFDLALMGIGADGHTASLFPEDNPHEASTDDDKLPWVIAVEAPDRHPVRERVTLTLPAINRSRHACFLVAGEGKREALHDALSGDDSVPATHVRPRGELVWFVDEEAHGEKRS